MMYSMVFEVPVLLLLIQILADGEHMYLVLRHTDVDIENLLFCVEYYHKHKPCRNFTSTHLKSRNKIKYIIQNMQHTYI